MTQACSITGKTYNPNDGLPWKELRPSLQNFLTSQRVKLDPDAFISFDALNDVIKNYITVLNKEDAEAQRKLLSRIGEEYDTNEVLKPIDTNVGEVKLNYGERLADRIASFGGSWTFIIIFLSGLMIWMAINAFYLSNKGFDPYPFILLNLILSCVAALQAPVIMMSQNRQEDKDRQRAEYDYKVNLKAETEIRLLHEKLDHILMHQNQSMVEMFQLHLDVLQQMQHRIESLKTN